MAAKPTVHPQRRFALVNALLLVLICGLAFAPCLRNGWVWDDDDYLTQNPSLENGAGLKAIWLEPESSLQYAPLFFTSFWLERHLGGASVDAQGAIVWHPWVFHLDNVLLHALAAVLLWRVLRRLDLPGAWIGGLLLAVHPVTVESVAWAAERKTVMGAVFLLGAALAWLRFGLDDDPGAEDRASARPRRWRCYVLALLLYACALLTKPATAPLPVVLFLLLWWKRRRLPRTELLSVLGMLPLGLALGMFHAHLERSLVNAEGPYWDRSLWESLALNGRAFCFYLGKLFWPARLSFIYPRWSLDATVAWHWLFPAAVVLFLAGLWLLRRRIGIAPLVGFLCYGALLFPALGFFNVYAQKFSWVADHWQYLACGAVFGLVAGFMARVLKLRSVEGPIGNGWNVQAWVAAAALAAGLGFLSFRQCGSYRDEETLWRATLARNPDAAIAHLSLGAILQAGGDMEAARLEYERDLELDSIDHAGLSALGQYWMRAGDLNRARPYLQQLADLYPTSFETHFSLSMLALNEGDYARAEAQARSALEIPIREWKAEEEGLARLNLGAAILLQGRPAEALSALERAVELQPQLAASHAWHGRGLALTGQTEAAMTELQAALAINGNEISALIDLSWIQSSHEDPRFRDPASALRLADSACRLTRQRMAEALDALAAAQAAGGRYQDARATAERAISAARAKAPGMVSRRDLYAAGQPYRSAHGLPE